MSVTQVEKAGFGRRELRTTSRPDGPALANIVGVGGGDDVIADELEVDVVPARGALQFDLPVGQAMQVPLPDREVLQRRNGLQRVDGLAAGSDRRIVNGYP
jgi:hypothetical protein